MSYPNLPRAMTRLRPSRRWTQFRLRTLLVAVTVACVLLGLLTQPLMEARRERAAIEALYKAGPANVTRNTVRYPGFGLFRELLGSSIYERVRQLSLAGPSVGDEDLRPLRDLRHLQVLELRATGVTDAGLVHLEGLTGLEGLRITDAPITDAGLARLRNLTAISALDLRHTQVTDAGLEHLRGMTELESLDVFGTQVTYAGLTRLEQELRLGNFAEERAIDEIEAVGGQVVTSRETLEEQDRLARYEVADYLHLDGSTMRGDAMPHVRYLRSLRDAFLRDLRPGDENLAPLSELPKLESLEVWLTDVDEKDLMCLGRIRSLRKLSFHHNEMTDAGLEHLANLNRLRELHFHQTQVTEQGVEPLRQSLADCRIEVRRDFSPRSQAPPKNALPRGSASPQAGRENDRRGPSTAQAEPAGAVRSQAEPGNENRD